VDSDTSAVAVAVAAAENDDIGIAVVDTAVPPAAAVAEKRMMAVAVELGVEHDDSSHRWVYVVGAAARRPAYRHAGFHIWRLVAVHIQARKSAEDMPAVVEGVHNCKWAVVAIDTQAQYIGSADRTEDLKTPTGHH
jgi:hypothetical protein